MRPGTIRSCSTRTAAARHPTDRRSRTSPASWPVSICSTRSTAARKSSGPISWRRPSSSPTRGSCSTKRCRRRLPKDAIRSRSIPRPRRIFLPGGKVPKPGDRFVNKDYAETLRTLAKEGGQSFYTGTIARRIADDMAANGGVITAEGPGAVPRGRTQAARGPLSQSPRLLGAGARADRPADRRDAADSRQLRSARRGDVYDAMPTTSTT